MQITSVEQLGHYVGQVVKYSEDGGNTWRYARIVDTGEPTPFSDIDGIGYGYPVNCEIIRGVHMTDGITEKMFERGGLVFLATPEEVEGKRFSRE